MGGLTDGWLCSLFLVSPARWQGSLVATDLGQYFMAHDSALPSARHNLTIRASNDLGTGHDVAASSPDWGPAIVVEAGAAAYSSLAVLQQQQQQQQAAMMVHGGRRGPETTVLGILYERGSVGCEARECTFPNAPPSLKHACSSCRVTFRPVLALQ